MWLAGNYLFVARLVEKGAFSREEKFQFGKKCKAVKSWNDMKNIFHNVTGSVNSKRAHPSSPGICGAFVCFFFFFSEPLQLPYGRGRGFIQRPHGGAEISVQMPDPGTTLKLHFLSSVTEA